jgi:hypothetical protein
MSNMKSKSERRFFERISDKSLLMVSGTSPDGQPFHENSQVNDVCSAGISFYMSQGVLPEQLLDLRIGDMEETRKEFVPSYGVKVRVLHVTPLAEPQPHYRVGAIFEGEIQQLETADSPESFANKLKEAFVRDEHLRHLN